MSWIWGVCIPLPIYIASSILLTFYTAFIGYDYGYRKGQEKTLQTIEKKLRGLW